MGYYKTKITFNEFTICEKTHTEMLSLLNSQ